MARTRLVLIPHQKRYQVRLPCQLLEDGKAFLAPTFPDLHDDLVGTRLTESAISNVLREVARRRCGDEEFLVILNNCDPSSAMFRAENLRTAISSRLVQVRSFQVSVTTSIAALSIDFANSEVDEIILQAVTTLYAAKAAERNCFRIAHPTRAAGTSNDPRRETPSVAT